MKFSQHNTSAARWLVIDAAMTPFTIGILAGDGHWLTLRQDEKDAGALEALQRGLDVALKETNLRLENLTGFIYDCGPGSLLGTRLVCMLLRTLKTLPELADKPVFAYKSLPFLLAAQNDEQAIALTPSRQGQWCAFDHEHGWRELPTAELETLAQKNCLFMPQRKQWEAPPSFFKPIVQTPLAENPQALLNDTLLEKTDTPDVFVVRPADYRAWIAPKN